MYTVYSISTCVPVLPVNTNTIEFCINVTKKVVSIEQSSEQWHFLIDLIKYNQMVEQLIVKNNIFFFFFLL